MPVEVSTSTYHFVMVPLNLTYLHCLQQSLFEHFFNLYYYICYCSVVQSEHIGHDRRLGGIGRVVPIVQLLCVSFRLDAGHDVNAFKYVMYPGIMYPETTNPDTFNKFSLESAQQFYYFQ